MKKLCINLSLLLIFNSSLIMAQVEQTISETKEFELPPAIQEAMQKEMEKLPPVEKHFRMAQDYKARGKYDDAMKELEIVLKEDPKHVPSNCEVGLVYMEKKEYDRAIEQLNKTLELDPTYPLTHYALANAYAQKPNPDVKLARKHLDEAIRLGYHAVPWFLDYMKKLEAQVPVETMPVIEEEKSLPETPKVE